MSNLEGGTWTAVSVSSYRIGSVRLSSSLCGWKMYLLSLIILISLYKFIQTCLYKFIDSLYKHIL